MEVVVTKVTQPTYSVQFEATKQELLALASALIYIDSIMPEGNVARSVKGLAEQIKSKVGSSYFTWDNE
jgi:hypothetical protein